MIDPHGIIGKEVPAADGGNYGHRVLGYDPKTGDYIVQAINWTSGKILREPSRIDSFKISYRYRVKHGRISS